MAIGLEVATVRGRTEIERERPAAVIRSPLSRKAAPRRLSCVPRGSRRRTVVVPRVSEVLGEGGEDAVAGDGALGEEPSEREHGEAAVLHLLRLELGERLRVLGEACRVEARVEALLEDRLLGAEALAAGREEGAENGGGRGQGSGRRRSIGRVIDAARDRGEAMMPRLGAVGREAWAWRRGAAPRQRP